MRRREVPDLVSRDSLERMSSFSGEDRAGFVGGSGGGFAGGGVGNGRRLRPFRPRTCAQRRPGRRRQRGGLRTAPVTTMVISGFLSDTGEYPVLPQPAAPLLSRSKLLELGDNLDFASEKRIKDRGLRLRRALPKPGVVVRIPRSDTVEVKRQFEGISQRLTRDAELVLGLRPSFWDEERRVVGDWRLRLAIRLLVDIRSDDSKAPYFALLPSDFDTIPAFWTREEVLEVQHIDFQLRILRQKIQWERICELVRCNSSVLDPREVLWAMAVVRSRAFSTEFEDRSSLINLVAIFWLLGATIPLVSQFNLQTSIAAGTLFTIATIVTNEILRDRRRRGFLVPIADLMRHSGSARATFRYDALSDSFLIASPEAMGAGEELFLNYDLPNDALLQFYGFVERDNPVNRYIICDTLNQFFNSTRFPRVKGRRGDAFSSKLLELPSAKGGGASISRDESGEVTFNPIFIKLINRITRSPERAKETLRDVCERELFAKSTTLDEDLATLSSLRGQSDSNPRKALAVEYRLSSKKLLQEAIARYS